MRKVSLDELIVGDDGVSQETARIFSRLPETYICDSIKDFTVNRKSIEEEYSTIIIQGIELCPAYDERGNMSRYMMSDGGSCLLFVGYDEEDETNLLWPEIDNVNINPEILGWFLDRPKKVDGLFLCYDSRHDNSFIMSIVDSYRRGVEEYMRQIWPDS